MNIQGEVQAFTHDSHKAINTGGRVKSDKVWDMKMMMNTVV